MTRARGVTFPLRTCQVPHLHFIDLMPLEQLRRFCEQSHASVLFAGATPLPDDADILRAVFGKMSEVSRPYPDRRIKQILLVFPDGRHGWGSLIDRDGKLIASTIEECGPQLIFTPTKSRAIGPSTTRCATTRRELVVERDRGDGQQEAITHRAAARRRSSRTAGASSASATTGCWACGAWWWSLRLAFRAIGSFTPEEITPEAFARLRRTDSPDPPGPRQGPARRGRQDHRPGGPQCRPGNPRGDRRGPGHRPGSRGAAGGSVVAGEDLGVLLDQAKRWLDAGGGPAPEPDPSKAIRWAGHPPPSSRAPTPEDAVSAVKSCVASGI